MSDLCKEMQSMDLSSNSVPLLLLKSILYPKVHFKRYREANSHCSCLDCQSQDLGLTTVNEWNIITC